MVRVCQALVFNLMKGLVAPGQGGGECLVGCMLDFTVCP